MSAIIQRVAAEFPSATLYRFLKDELAVPS